MNDPYNNPLQYLSRVERLLVGWAVARMFASNRPRFAKWVQSSGPHATARFACGQTFNFYAAVLALVATAFIAAGIPSAAVVFYSLMGVCLIWSVTCVILALGPQRKYRRTRQIHQDG